jgi:aquaporin Z
MNPARSLAPALVSGHLQCLWIYLLAPVLGALLATPVCLCVHDRPCCGTSLKESCHEASQERSPVRVRGEQ